MSSQTVENLPKVRGLSVEPFGRLSRRILRAQAQGCLLGGQILADSEGGDVLIEE